MIIREWRGRASTSHAEAYPRHFRSRVLPELQRVPGFLKALLSKCSTDAKIELVSTRWQFLEAIQAFAGDHIGDAVVEPEGIAPLAEFDPFVRHYEVIEDVQNSE